VLLGVMSCGYPVCGGHAAVAQPPTLIVRPLSSLLAARLTVVGMQAKHRTRGYHSRLRTSYSPPLSPFLSLLSASRCPTLCKLRTRSLSAGVIIVDFALDERESM